MYNLKKIKEQIQVAKETASTVIVMEHLGSETKTYNNFNYEMAVQRIN